MKILYGNVLFKVEPEVKDIKMSVEEEFDDIKAQGPPQLKKTPKISVPG